MHNSNQILSFYTLLFLLFNWNMATAKVKTPLRQTSAEECKSCHEEIYSQWKGSIHANSTALQDPIHGAFYQAVIGDPLQENVRKNGKYPVCLQCHSPAAAKDGKTNMAAMQVYNEGVNCVACHTVSGFKGTRKANGKPRLGTQAYEYSDTSLQGPGTNHSGFDWQHPVFQNTANPEIIKTNAICLGCHDQRKNSNKVPLCQTGDEVAESDKGTNCLNCHMPVVNGKADHSFLGGHSAKMVSKGLVMTMATVTKANSINIVISLANQLPHKFPTGAPFRNVYIKLTAYDKGGQEVWKSSQTHPVKDDKQAMLMYSLGDKEGNPAPPPKATQVLGDTRLKPYEVRKLNYTLPVKNAARLRAVAYYDLLLAPMKKQFSNSEHKDLLTAKVIAVVENQMGEE